MWSGSGSGRASLVYTLNGKAQVHYADLDLFFLKTLVNCVTVKVIYGQAKNPN